MRRADYLALCAGLLWVSCFAVGCSSTRTIQVYAGEPLPAEEVVVLTEGSPEVAEVIAIDGVRVRGAAFHVAPGEHEVWAEVRVRLEREVLERVIVGVSPSSYDRREVEVKSVAGKTYCRYRFEAIAGSRWELTARTDPVEFVKVHSDVFLIDTEGRETITPKHCPARPDF